QGPGDATVVADDIRRAGDDGGRGQPLRQRRAARGSGVLGGGEDALCVGVTPGHRRSANRTGQDRHRRQQPRKSAEDADGEGGGNGGQACPGATVRVNTGSPAAHSERPTSTTAPASIHTRTNIARSGKW